LDKLEGFFLGRNWKRCWRLGFSYHIEALLQLRDKPVAQAGFSQAVKGNASDSSPPFLIINI
tara:strand:- start:861 stop:1046 length:186 start_codon:yes stop_codon:yes gene_type:complete